MQCTRIIVFCTVIFFSLSTGMTSCSPPWLHDGPIPPSTHTGPLTVTYHETDSTGGIAPVDANTYSEGTTVTVLGNGVLTRSGYTWAGWNTQSDRLGISYAGAATFDIGADNVDLYPVWIPNDLTFTSSGTSIEVTGYTVEPGGELAIPAGVTGLGYRAFVNCTNVTSIVIPASCTVIGEGAFRYCTHAVSVNLPSTLARIGPEAFMDCLLLGGDITLDSVTYLGQQSFYNTHITGITINSTLQTINYLTFGYCDALTMITIPHVTTIERYAFYNCKGLVDVVIPDGVTTIGGSAFSSCDILTHVAIPASVTAIANIAFCGCPRLTNIEVDPANQNFKMKSGWLFSSDGTILLWVPDGITGKIEIPSSVKTIAGAFCGCGELNEVIIPPGLTDITEYSFYGCLELTGIYIPDSVVTIGPWAFAHCYKLTRVVISKALVAIDSYAFHLCHLLTEITLPESLIKIGDHAFSYCTSMINVCFLATTPPALPDQSGAFFAHSSRLLIHVPENAASLYTNAEGWSEYADLITYP